MAVPVAALLHPRSYAEWYWPIQFATLTFGCGIVVEILNHVLRTYSGAQKFARTIAILAFTAVALLAAGFSLASSGWSATGVMVDLERNLRTTQALLLFGVLLLVAYYRIPMGRNMRGMILGYGIYVGTSLFALAVAAYAGTWLEEVWVLAQPLSFAIALLIWLVMLWSYEPNPIAENRVPLESDYELLAARTQRALNATRTYLGKATRQ
jgi:hypothetical protein